MGYKGESIMDCGYFYAPYPDLPIPESEAEMNNRHQLWLRAAVELIQDRLRQNESRDGDVDTLEGVRDLIQLILEDLTEKSDPPEEEARLQPQEKTE